MNEIKEITFTLDSNYGRLKRKEQKYISGEVDKEYTIQDLLDECDELCSEFEDLENERDDLQNQFDEANKKIEELEKDKNE